MWPNALFTSQPGVSRQIRELEDELGVVIFERNGKRLTGLTEPGKGILKIIERLLVEAENLQQASQEYAGQDSGTLTIAVTHTQARYALPQVVQSFRNRLPRRAHRPAAKRAGTHRRMGAVGQGRHRHRHRRPVAVPGPGVLPVLPLEPPDRGAGRPSAAGRSPIRLEDLAERIR
jgi:LysR family cys regulon transcriptional activator